MAEDVALPGTLDRGRYRIERILGVGGTATVLLAFDTRMGVYRAAKLLDPKVARSAANRARFQTEAHAQASLKHANVLMVHDTVEDEQGVYLIMELAESDSLGDRVLRSGPLAPAEVLDVGIAIGGALAAAHAAGLIHRDVKPANILVDKHGLYKLADFGIARDTEREAALTQVGTVMGTWAFMPPEQREDSRRVDARSDIYAFGVTLYALLVGRHSQSLHNREAWAQAFATVPPGIAAILQRATRLYPEDRYASMEEMLADLRRERATIGEDGQAVAASPTLLPVDDGRTLPPPEVTAGPALAPRKPVLLFVLGLGGLLAVGGGLWALAATGGSPVVDPAPVSQPTRPTAPAPATTRAPEASAPSTPSAAASPVPPSAPAATKAAPPESSASSAVAARPTAPARRIIEVVPAEAAATTPATPATPAPAAAEATGTVVVRTVPSGATVLLGGRVLRPGPGDSYSLPVGTQTLTLRSADGEQTRLAVAIRAGATTELCYSFDTNRSCAP